MRVAAQPAVSVIVPMHNAERHVRDALESIASQSLLDFEVIVVDDGSTDRSREIVESFVDRDNRFLLVEGPAEGSAGAARNVGLDLARGEYLAFLDADDLMTPSALEKMYSKATADGADVVFTGFRTLDDATGKEKAQRWALRVAHLPTRTPFPPEEIADHLFYVTNPANWNKLFRRSFINERGLRFQPIRRANDAYFTFASLALSRRLSYIAEGLVLYRVGNTASLQGSNHETPLEFIKALTAIHDALNAAGVDRTYRRAFVNLVATMSFGALAHSRTSSSYVETYSAIRNDLFPRFELSKMPPEAFLTPQLFKQVTEIAEKTATDWLFDETRSVARRESKVSDIVAIADGEMRVSSFSNDQDHVGITVPDVTVIVPVHNSSPWLHECLLSVLGQSGVTLEVICVNDGSTDDSLRILNEYATSDARVLIINQQNGGLSVARNSGLDIARGRYTCMIDSDDYWKLDELSQLVARADRDALDVLLFDAASFFDPGVTEASYKAYATYYNRKRAYSAVVTGVELIDVMRKARDYRPSACLYLMKTAFVNELNLRFIPGVMHEDNPFTFALLLGATRASHEKNAIYARRVRPGSIMTSGATERSAQGYFSAYLDMSRSLATHRVPAEMSPTIGGLVHEAYASSRRRFLELPAGVGDRIWEHEATPEAHSAYLMLKYDRDREAQISKISKGA